MSIDPLRAQVILNRANTVLGARDWKILAEVDMRLAPSGFCDIVIAFPNKLTEVVSHESTRLGAFYLYGGVVSAEHLVSYGDTEVLKGVPVLPKETLVIVQTGEVRSGVSVRTVPAGNGQSEADANKKGDPLGDVLSGLKMAGAGTVFVALVILLLYTGIGKGIAK